MSDERPTEVDGLNEFGDRLERAVVAEAARPWFVRLRRILTLSAVVVIGVPVAIAGAVELRGDPPPEGPYVDAQSCESLALYDVVGQSFDGDCFAPECPSREAVLRVIADIEPSFGIATLCRRQKARSADAAEVCEKFLRNRAQYLAGVKTLEARGAGGGPRRLPGRPVVVRAQPGTEPAPSACHACVVLRHA